MRKIRIGLLGCGRVASIAHIPSLNNIVSAEIVALAEPVEQRQHTAMEVFPNARKYADYRQLIEHEELDAVVIGLPSDLHADAACVAMARGIHVYIEKPLATDLASAQEVLQVWQQSGLVGMLGLNLRRNPIYAKAREIVQSGQLGQIIAVRSMFGSSRRKQPSWRESHEMGGGALLNLSPHPIDMISHLVDRPIVEVFAYRPTIEPDLTMTLQFRLEGGLLAQSVLSMTSYSADEIEIIGDSATLLANRRAAKLTLLAPDTYDSSKKRLVHELTSMTRAPGQILNARGEPSYFEALSDFVYAVQGGKTGIRPNVEDGLRVQAVIEAAWESATSGQPVRVTSV